MELIDIGANLTHESFSHDYAEVLASARAAGVAHIIITGTDLESALAARTLASESGNLLSSTAGFHPHVASQCNLDSFRSIAALAEDPSVVAIGETGLDFNRKFSPVDAQIEAFEKHLQLAVELQKPLFLHQRDAHDEFFRLLKLYRRKISGGVVHCFTDNESALQDYIELDMYIGITGWICDERRGEALQKIVSKIPSERLLIETDSPYLLPRSIKPRPKTRRNEPKYLPEVLNMIASCTGRSIKQLAQETRDNSIRLFKLSNA